MGSSITPVLTLLEEGIRNLEVLLGVVLINGMVGNQEINSLGIKWYDKLRGVAVRVGVMTVFEVGGWFRSQM